MKKLICMIALVMLMALLLCACTDTTAGDNSSSKPAETTSAPESTGSNDTTPPTDSKPAEDGKKTYTVTVLDQNNNPVAGVSVQFCDENNKCQLPVKTNEQGVVSKSLEPMGYHVTLTLPEGYSCDTLEYNMDGATELTVTVTAG